MLGFTKLRTPGLAPILIGYDTFNWVLGMKNHDYVRPMLPGLAHLGSVTADILNTGRS